MKSALGTDSILESGAEILQKICEKVEVRTVCLILQTF